jgi:hypothetical protein
MTARARRRRSHRRLERRQQQSQVEFDEIDVRHGEHHLPPQHYSLVEDVVQHLGELDAGRPEQVVDAH